MRKNSIRIIALILIACLAGDQATSFLWELGRPPTTHRRDGALFPAGAATFKKWDAALVADPSTAAMIHPDAWRGFRETNSASEAVPQRRLDEEALADQALEFLRTLLINPAPRIEMLQEASAAELAWPGKVPRRIPIKAASPHTALLLSQDSNPTSGPSDRGTLEKPPAKEIFGRFYDGWLEQPGGISNHPIRIFSSVTRPIPGLKEIKPVLENGAVLHDCPATRVRWPRQYRLRRQIQAPAGSQPMLVGGDRVYVDARSVRGDVSRVTLVESPTTPSTPTSSGQAAPPAASKKPGEGPALALPSTIAKKGISAVRAAQQEAWDSHDPGKWLPRETKFDIERAKAFEEQGFDNTMGGWSADDAHLTEEELRWIQINVAPYSWWEHIFNLFAPKRFAEAHWSHLQDSANIKNEIEAAILEDLKALWLEGSYRIQRKVLLAAFAWGAPSLGLLLALTLPFAVIFPAHAHLITFCASLISLLFATTVGVVQSRPTHIREHRQWNIDHPLAALMLGGASNDAPADPSGPIWRSPRPHSKVVEDTIQTVNKAMTMLTQEPPASANDILPVLISLSNSFGKLRLKAKDLEGPYWVLVATRDTAARIAEGKRQMTEQETSALLEVLHRAQDSLEAHLRMFNDPPAEPPTERASSSTDELPKGKILAIIALALLGGEMTYRLLTGHFHAAAQMTWLVPLPLPRFFDHLVMTRWQEFGARFRRLARPLRAAA